MKEDLQCLVLRVSLCLLNNINLEEEWIPRSANDRADFLGIIVDCDDGKLRVIIFSWTRLSGIRIPWTGLQTIRTLSCPVFIVDFGALRRRGWTHLLFHGLARITVPWAGENNWLVPPIFLIPIVLNHLAAFGGQGTLFVPAVSFRPSFGR